jgi:hypothetical protein
LNGCVLDTDVVIAALDRSDARHPQAAHVIRTMIDAGVPLMLSVINYAETLVRPPQTKRPYVAPSQPSTRSESNWTPHSSDRPRRRSAAIVSFDQRVSRAAKAANIELARPDT